MNCQTNDNNKARVMAVSAPHSGDWLNALPISRCGLRLDNEAIRVAVGLRLGSDLCMSHQCPCGALVEINGIHGLSCKKNNARIMRHGALNDVIHRSLVKAAIPSLKEPPGLLRSDGKRPDGVTLIPYSLGKCLAWDVTVTDTLAPSYVGLSVSSAGSAAERAAANKVAKYTELSLSYEFVPLAFETLGPINQSGLVFLQSLGKKITASTGDVRETAFLLQRISITLQRYNSIAFHNSFIADTLDS